MESGKIKVAFLPGAIPRYNPIRTFRCIFQRWNDTNPPYKFVLKEITDKEIINGYLSVDNFDILIFPGIGRGYPHIFDEPFPVPWKDNIRKFVSDGGGYLGICGGAVVAGYGLVNRADTIWEKVADESTLKIANVKVYQDISLPMWGDKVGQSAYMWYGSGIPAKVEVNREHPIFSVCPKKLWTIRHMGGPAFVEMENKEVSILATYQEELSDIAPIHVWKWGPFLREEEIPEENLFDFLKRKGLEDIIDLKDWEKQKEMIRTNVRGKAAAVANEYGQGRVVIFGPHPEYPSWEGGYLEEAEDTPHNRMGELFRWRSNKWVSNEWIILRSAAWAVGIPDEELPSIPL